jgi:amidase
MDDMVSGARRSLAIDHPLHGIPILVKDNYDTGDMPTTNASEALAGTRPPDDATQVAKLRAAGAIIIAKTNLHHRRVPPTSTPALPR